MFDKCVGDKGMKNKNNNSTGFTLVELLGILAVLAVVLTIVMYSVIGIVKNSKTNSYQVTINNVQDVASNYVLEDLSLVSWVDEGSYQYQCVTVQNLIDAGYFKGDVLESQVDDDLPLRASDQVYLEKDSFTKAVTKSILLVGDRSSYTGLCGYINKSGNIRITANPNGWSKQKELTTYYRVYQGNVSDYKYEYSYILNDGSVDGSNAGTFNNSAIYKKYTIDSVGTMYAKIKDLEGNEIATESLSIIRIDNTDPSATISSTNNVATSQTVTLSMSDGGSGVKSYYFGKTNPNTNDVNWIDLSLGVATGESVVSVGKRSYSITKTIDGSGKYYFAVKDLVGNTAIVSKEFYKTTLSISNATVTPSYVITMSGNQFNVPTVTANSHYTFSGWYSNSGYSGGNVTTYKPTGNATLYGKVTINTYTITLNNNGATTSGTDKIYEKYGVGIYLDSANTKLMSTGGNKITVPTKTDYEFGGYYNGDTQVISASGYLVSGITNTTFTGDTILTAKWIDITPPTCSFSIADGYVNLVYNDNVGVIYKGLSSGASIDYNNVERLALSVGTIYGYVKDDAGNEGNCSVNIKNVTNVYTCSKSARHNSSVACSSSNYNNPSGACVNKYYSSNNCSVSTKYTIHYATCFYDEANRKYTWRVDNGLTKYNQNSCSVQVTANTSCSYKQHQDGLGGRISSCSANNTYSGTISCYSYYCDKGTYDSRNCYLYNRTSCSSGWSSSISSTNCDSGYTKTGNYCYKIG